MHCHFVLTKIMEEDVNLKFDGYDEDLNENLFFKYIQTKHKSLYDETAKHRWIICVPRKGTLSRSNHTLKDVENHFLQPTEGEGSHSYTTLNDKHVKVNEGFIFTEKGFEDVKYVRIVFEETFFNSNNESYQVLCLDQPLEGGIGVSADPVVQALDNLHGCIDFLWPSTGTKQGQKQIDEIIRLFNSTYQQLEGESLRHLMDAANAIYTRAMQAALKNTQLRKLSQSNKSYLDNIKLAIETYVIHGLYNQLMKGISCIVGNEDAALNKITRNLADIQIRDLGIKPEICTNLPRGRRMLSFLNRFTSPLEKFHCLKKSITLITERKMKDKEPGVVDAITADDLLPALVFLVIKSDIPNWLANITFLHNFHFSKCGYNEFQFYLSSLEAAVEHVRSGFLTNTFKGGIPFKRLQDGNAGSYSFWQQVDFDGNKPTALDMLFEYTAQGKEREVEKLLGNEEKENLRLDKMCHPLCSCDKCEKMLSKRRNDPSAVTVFSRDDMGRTVLHVAAEYGHANLTYYIIRKGGVVNTMDYHGSTPLHMACLRGHSKVVLILLHYKADANAIDNDGNTPMHLCAANGHDQCCRSLVYSDMNHRILKINVANENGDTPLHLAARWGYVDLVDLLIERGASIEARNKNKQSPLDCAHSQQVSEIILDAQAAHIEKETGFLAFLPDEEVKRPSRSLRVPIKGSTGSSLAGSPASSLERQSPKEVDVFLRTVADGDIEMVRFRLSLDEEDEEDASDMPCKSEMDLCHPLCQCDKCIKWQKLTCRSLEHNIHVNSSNKDGITPLHVAAVRGYTAIANLLLRHGADPNAKNKSKEHTPLHLACQYNHSEVTELLLNYSAKINMKDYKGNTPLHFCCLNGHMAPALVLLERNVNVDVANDRGNTPLHEAARWNLCELVRVLLEHGACADLRNKMQLTPLQFAKDDDVVKVFQQSDKNAKESRLTRRKTWAGLSKNSNVNQDVILPNPVESLGTSPNPTQQQASTSGVRVIYSNATKTIEMEEKPRNRSLTASSICDTTIEQPQTKLSKIFEHLEHGEVEKLQEIAKAVRAFDRRKSLKRAVTIDKSLPFFALNVDRENLDELDQDAYDADMFDRPIIPPNNTPIDPSPSDSSPLLDRVRNILLEDASTRPSASEPLLNRVKTILQATGQDVRPAYGYAANNSSLEDSRRSNDVSGGAVLESAHPELVSIVEGEIQQINQDKGSTNSDSHPEEIENHELTSNTVTNIEKNELDKQFEADSILPGRSDIMIDNVNHVDAHDEAARSFGCESHPPESQTFTSREDFQEGDREAHCDEVQFSEHQRMLGSQGAALEEGTCNQQGASGINDSLSSVETCRSMDCHCHGDSNQNNNVNPDDMSKCGCEIAIYEASNDNHETKFVGDHSDVSDKVGGELMSESGLYDEETHKMSTGQNDSILESVEIHEISTDTGYSTVGESNDTLDSVEAREKPTEIVSPTNKESNEKRETSPVSGFSLVEGSDTLLESVEIRETSTDDASSTDTECDGVVKSFENRETSTDNASSTVTASDGVVESVGIRETSTDDASSTVTASDGVVKSVEIRETSTDDASSTVTESDGVLKSVENRETSTDDASSTVTPSDEVVKSVENRETSTDDASSTVTESDGVVKSVENRETSTDDASSTFTESDGLVECVDTA